MVQEERDWVDEQGRNDLLRKCWVLQHVGSDRSAKGVGHYNDSVEVVCSEDLRDRETGALPIERGAGYPIADREYLVVVLKPEGDEEGDDSTSTIMIPKSGSSLESSRIKGM